MAEPLDFNVIVDRITREVDGGRNFDMYALAWSLSRFPTHLYTLFHSNFDVDGGDNTPGLRDPEYDAVAERVWTPRTYEDAFEAAFEAQEIFSWLQPYVPLYSRPYMDAFRSDIVTGYVPHLGFGAASDVYGSIWTPLNIRRVDQERGGTIRWVLEEEPGNLNVLIGTSAYDARIFGLVYGPGLITSEPVKQRRLPVGSRAVGGRHLDHARGQRGHQGDLLPARGHHLARRRALYGSRREVHHGLPERAAGSQV